jgi:hypothetical protein
MRSFQRTAALAVMFAALVSPLAASAPGKVCKGEDAPMKIVIDSVHREMTLTVGPCRLPPMDMSTMSMPGMKMDGEYSGKVDIQMRFLWPMTSYLRGWDLTILDSLGRKLPQHTMHHMEMLNFDRRQLAYPMAERVMGIGEETGPAFVPKSVGLPLEKGSHMGLYIMWNNETDTDMDGIYLQLRMPWAPTNMTPKPVKVLPFKLDVNLHVGRGDGFDFPDGFGSRTSEFTVPISGRLIAIGGHMHDFGKELRLEDVLTGKVIARVKAKRTPDGRVTDVEHQLFGIWGRGPRLIPGRTYRFVAVYDDPARNPIMGAMGVFGGIFAPDHMSQWPKVDFTNSDYITDLGDMLPPNKWGTLPKHQ